MWQALKSLTTTEHSWEESGKKKKGRLKKKDSLFGLVRNVRKKHYKVEHLHARGWVVKVVFC
jgi:hypothetical protein